MIFLKNLGLILTLYQFYWILLQKYSIYVLKSLIKTYLLLQSLFLRTFIHLSVRKKPFEINITVSLLGLFIQTTIKKFPPYDNEQGIFTVWNAFHTILMPKIYPTILEILTQNVLNLLSYKLIFYF